MSSYWEIVKYDDLEEVKDFKKFKEKMMERYLIEGFKKILIPKMEIDDEEEFEENEEKKESLDKHLSAFFEEMMNYKESSGH